MSNWQFWLLMFSLWFSTAGQSQGKFKRWSLGDIIILTGFIGSFIMIIVSLV